MVRSTPMAFGTRIWKLGRFLLLVATLGVTFLVFFGLALRVALRAREVQVPALIGVTVNDATRAAAERGLGIRIDENRRTSDRVPAGRIMEQEPPAGAQARRQRTVRVWVSSGQRVTVVPALAGQTERTARLRLDQEGLTVGTITEIRRDQYPTDAVVAQNPPPRANAPAVALLLNRAPPAPVYVMPDVVGTDAARAADAFRAQGLRVTIVPPAQAVPAQVPPVQAVPGAAASAGAVTRQQPAAGAPVSAGDPITFEVSR